jgi:chorismate mutase
LTKEEASAKLEEYRVLIDEIDRRVVDLLNERTSVVEGIGEVKRQARLPIYEPRREDQVFANVTGANRGPLTAEAVRRVFERIIDEMRTVQRLKIEAAANDKAVRNESDE